MFVHNVFFWLKPGTPASVREAMIRDAHQELGRIPIVKHIFVGEPALTPREVVDNTYDVALSVVFDDRAGHDIYQAHEIHKAFTQRYKPDWQRITVYDFL